MKEPEVVTGAEQLAQRTIVVGVDSSDESHAAARWAAALAVQTGATLVAVHAWHWPYQAAPIGIHPETISFAEDGGTALLERVVASLRADHPALKVEASLVSGAAFGALVEHSERADLVVVGRHGRNMVSRFFLGSTSTAVANHARCPVAVIPPDASPLPTDPAVMVAIDGSARSLDAAVWAFEELPPACRFVLVHSHDEWLLDNLDTPDAYREQRQAEAEKLLADAVASIGDVARRAEAVSEQLVLPGDPRETVIRSAADTDVLVVGARGHTGLTGVLLGSFATYALHNAQVPLIIVTDGVDRRSLSAAKATARNVADEGKVMV